MGIKLTNINRLGRVGRVGFRALASTTPATPQIPPPTWITPPGSLGAFDEGSAVSIQVEAADPNDNITNWSVTSGSLPAGLDLNPFTGTILGTPEPVVSGDETATFTIRIADEDGNVLTGVFSITIRDLPSVEWVTPTGTVAETSDWADLELQLEAKQV